MKLRETAPGMPTAVAALVIALDECGARPKETYRNVLLRLWSDLPEEETFDADDLVCQRLLEYLT